MLYTKLHTFKRDVNFFFPLISEDMTQITCQISDLYIISSRRFISLKSVLLSSHLVKLCHTVFHKDLYHWIQFKTDLIEFHILSLELKFQAGRWNHHWIMLFFLMLTQSGAWFWPAQFIGETAFNCITKSFFLSQRTSMCKTDTCRSVTYSLMNQLMIYSILFCLVWFLVACTLQPALSVCLSVGRSVGPSRLAFFRHPCPPARY